MNSTVPDGWKLHKFGDIAEFYKGLTYATSNYSDKYTGYPFITLKCIKKDGGFSTVGLKYYDGTFKPHHIVNTGDVVFANTDLTRDGDVVGSPLRVPLLHSDRPSLISMDLSKVLPKDGTDSNFIYYWLKMPTIKRFMINYSAGSTVLHLHTSSVPNIPVLTPPLPEQQKIASILTSVDDVIEKTESQISKLQDLKRGMMQELLTKGIGHTEFKDSAVGRIPVEWEVKSISSLGTVVTGNTPKTSNAENYGGKIAFISPADIGLAMYINTTKSSITEKGLNETRTLPTDSICVVCIGSTIGKTGITTSICATNQQINSIICNGSSPEFVYYLMTYYSTTIKSEASTQAVPIINKSAFSALLVQIPPIQEQQNIGASIACIDNKISAVIKKLGSLKNNKKALMQDLLTGNVRVNVD